MNENNKGNYTPNRKREIIKTILIVFLIVMLVLTFCSNTIMNKSLAEITTESATSGKLTERIRGSGLVESNQSYDVKVDGNKIIDTIMIKTGQEVKKGDVYTIAQKIERTGTDMYKLKSGVYITASTKYVEVFER